MKDADGFGFISGTVNEEVSVLQPWVKLTACFKIRVIADAV